MVDALIALSLLVVAVFVGLLGYHVVVQRRELDACARAIETLREVWNSNPEVPKIPQEPALPSVAPLEAPAGTEPLVLSRAVAWEEWRDEK